MINSVFLYLFGHSGGHFKRKNKPQATFIFHPRQSDHHPSVSELLEVFGDAECLLAGGHQSFDATFGDPDADPSRVFTDGPRVDDEQLLGTIHAVGVDL